MSTVEHVLSTLKEKGREQTRKTYLRHGIAGDVYGVSIADLKLIAKTIKGNQPLACELYATGNYDAMYLAGIVAHGSQMTKQQLDTWAKQAKFGAISEYTVPGVAAESPHARELALKWIGSPKESIAASGWCTYSGIVAITPDEGLDLAEIEELLEQVVDEIGQAHNRVRYSMNCFVIAVGAYVKPLLKLAKQVAKKIGVVEVDMGNTACKIPVASEYIAKIESCGRVGKKRKTAKCG